jgi:hypothetical protein
MGVKKLGKTYRILGFEDLKNLDAQITLQMPILRDF